MQNLLAGSGFALWANWNFRTDVPHSPSICACGGMVSWTNGVNFIHCPSVQLLDTPISQVCIGLGQGQHVHCLDVKDSRLCMNEKGNDNPKIVFFGMPFEIYIDSKADSEQSMDLNDYQFLISISGDKTILKATNSWCLMVPGFRKIMKAPILWYTPALTSGEPSMMSVILMQVIWLRWPYPGVQ